MMSGHRVAFVCDYSSHSFDNSAGTIEIRGIELVVLQRIVRDRVEPGSNLYLDVT